ncbi:MAG: YgiQ family radical SAM protein [Clostridia bacterium]|nr:YgiQ family radical SAM protein [Clostridia bacterium]
MAYKAREKHIDTSRFVPMSAAELRERDIEQLDFVYIIGDAYVDHPSFGPAIISRVLESHGYTVGIISQPDWHSAEDFKRLGKPRLAFLISAGNIDSMVNHYTAAKKRRSSDAYTPGGEAGKRPDRATIVYANRAREAYRGVPVIIGGIEASLRRFAHYDYWDDKVRSSILSDAGADLLLYGMGEKQIVEVADALAGGLAASDITYIPGTAYMTHSLERVYEYKLIESYETVAKDKKAYASAFMAQYREQDSIRGKRLVQPHGDSFLVVNPPAAPLTTEELDAVYELPYTRQPHPSYQKEIPALFEIKFSLTSCRGCFGACSFCALTFHQGRVISARSHASLIREAKLLTEQPDFKGNIHDVGGPTANFRQPACKKQLKSGVCADRQCLGFEHCKNLEVDHRDYIALLEKLSAVPGVKKVFVRSGIRYDYVMYDKSDAFLRALIKNHVSGQLKVAPEHVSDRVLRLMGKPSNALYERFVAKYMQLNRNMGKEQYIVPYLMSSHPGSDLEAAIELAEYLKRTGHRPEQVQDFYPTPGTLSTCMYHVGFDPRTGEKVYVPKSPGEKAMQRALMQYFLPQYRDLARAALLKTGREDLVGFGKNALVPPKMVPPKMVPPPQAKKPEGAKRTQPGTKKAQNTKGKTEKRSGKRR